MTNRIGVTLAYRKIEGKIRGGEVQELFRIKTNINPTFVLDEVNSGKRCYLIAYHHGEAVGFIRYSFPGSHEHGEKLAIHEYYTMMKFRRRGIDEKMTIHLIDYATSKGLPVISVDNSSNMVEKFRRMQRNQRENLHIQIETVPKNVRPHIIITSRRPRR